MKDQVYHTFTELLKRHELVLSDTQWDQFEVYCRELNSWNEKMNLTAIKDREQVYIKHFYDCISLSFFFPLNSVTTLADIGSGAGFPSIPLKIMFPHLKITIIDSLNKRIQFLEHLSKELELTGVQCVHSRAEDAARQPRFRDGFDLVTARAVAKLNVLNELCLPFVKKEGIFIAMKGVDPKEELAEAAFSLMQLHSKLLDVFAFDLPVEQSSRHLIILKKYSKTPAKYPRKAGTPLKAPLV